MSLLASVRPAAGTETTIYTVPSGKKAVVNVLVMNVDTVSGCVFDFGQQSTAGAFASKDYIFRNRSLMPNSDPIQLTGLVLSSGESIRGRSSTGTVNFQVNGLVESL